MSGSLRVQEASKAHRILDEVNRRITREGWSEGVSLPALRDDALN